MFYVYILQSKVDNSFYIGQTKDLDKRLVLHNEDYLDIQVEKGLGD
jgi:putative endonuclease